MTDSTTAAPAAAPAQESPGFYAGFEQWLLDNPLVAEFIGLALLTLVSIMVFLVVRRIILPVLGKLVARTKTDWDDILVDGNFLHWLAWIPVTGVVYYGIDFVPNSQQWLTELIRNVSIAGTLLFTLLAIGSLLTAVNTIYSRRDIAKERPIKGYLQLLKVFLYVVGFIVIIAIAVGASPWRFVAGFGAMTAVLLLIFKDTILSLVASVQITSNDMLRIGDWLEMPSVGADGDVIDISLHTVKVQNWDKTISTIPTHKLISGSFKNWRGMQESGGRRIKRHIHVDMSSVRFLTDEEVQKYGDYRLLKDYIAGKNNELDAWNTEHNEGDDFIGNSRRLTNLGTLRAYITQYLRSRPDIHQEGMTFLIRQLQASEKGVAIELYIFTKTVNWVEYEGIQADIFDHILAIIPELGLRVFQNPTGSDFQQLNTTS